MTINHPECHSERSEESHALIGRITNENQQYFHYPEPALTVGILPRPKARSE